MPYLAVCKYKDGLVTRLRQKPFGGKDEAWLYVTSAKAVFGSSKTAEYFVEPTDEPIDTPTKQTTDWRETARKRCQEMKQALFT